MAGIVTITEETYGTMKKISFAWTSTAGGVADGTTTNTYTGEVRRLVTIPGTAGDQPTALYDITMKDEDSTDILIAAGANRSNVNTEQVLATSLGVIANDKIRLDVAAAGDTKKGTAIIYIR